jgi:hypothetical protein
MERVDDIVWLQWRAALACGHARERSEHLCREFPVEETEIDIRIYHGNPWFFMKSQLKSFSFQVTSVSTCPDTAAAICALSSGSGPSTSSISLR